MRLRGFRDTAQHAVSKLDAYDQMLRLDPEAILCEPIGLIAIDTCHHVAHEARNASKTVQCEVLT